MEKDRGNRRTIGIIGAGVTGLAAGCFAQMNGYEATIFESHRIPGGLCTSWKKGDDYTIDGCIEWLVGVAPHGSLHQGWMELGALQGKTIVNHDIYLTYEAPDGRVLNLYSDVDRLEKHFLEFSPQDAASIRRLTAAIRLLAKMDRWEWDWKDLFLFPRHLGRILWAFTTPVSRFGKKFKDPFLKKVFTSLLGMPEMPVGLHAMTLAWHHNKNGGYPIGGSLEFAKSVEHRFLGLGGRVYYGAKVDRILEGEGRAAGVKLADGREFYFNRIIAAGDGHLTFDRLLQGRYDHEELYRRFKGLKPFSPLLVFSFGVKRDMAKEPHGLLIPLDPPWRIGAQAQETLYIRHYAHDPTLAPPGRTVVKVSFPADYDYWKELHADPAAYETRKHALARDVLVELEKRFPGIIRQVEVTDVATPITFERYTHNWRGSIEGWLPDLRNFLFPLPKTLKGLKGLYFAGQWVQPGGGLPTCLMTGKGIIRKICKEDGKPFTTSLPTEIHPPPENQKLGPEPASLAEEIFANRR